MHRRTPRLPHDDLPYSAGNGLLDRRALFRAGVAAAASAGIARSAHATELQVAPWMREVGAPFAPYGQPAQFESKVVRTVSSVPGTTGTGVARTPLHALDGV